MATTDRRRRPDPAPRVRPGWVYGTTFAGFLGAGALIGTQMAAGHDPALGAGTPAQKHASAQPAVVVKRIEKRVVKTRIVKHVRYRDVQPSAAAAATPQPSAPAPTRTYVQKAQTYSPPAPAPAPAPAPSQPTTRSS